MGNAESQGSKGFKGSAGGAAAPVQQVQISGAKVVQKTDGANCPGCTSILDVEISCFANYRATDPKPVNLLTWLKSDKHAKKVQTIRATADKSQRDRIKATLPAITPSGIFSERKTTGLIKHSGFLQFDVDGVHNTEATKAKIISLSNVVYCGLSVSGRGLWGLIPIAHPEHHKEYFLLIEKAFAGMGIIIDTSCKDVSRLRGYSYDPDGYFNFEAKPLEKWYEPKKPHRQQRVWANSNDNANKVEICLQQITTRNIDLTVNYSDWFSIGCSFASEFGEGGRDYFHGVSQFHPGYTVAETDKQFNKCLKSGFSIEIGHFFNRCKEVGIQFKEIAPVQNGKNYPIDNQLVKWCNFKGHIGIAPVAPPVQKEPDYPASWDCTPGYTDKWQLINHLVNAGIPLWLAEAKGVLSDYEAGLISKEQRLDALQTNFEKSGLSYEKYKKEIDGNCWE